MHYPQDRAVIWVGPDLRAGCINLAHAQAARPEVGPYPATKAQNRL